VASATDAANGRARVASLCKDTSPADIDIAAYRFIDRFGRLIE